MKQTNDQPTIKPTKDEEFSYFSNLSSRLARIELSYIQLDETVTKLAQQLLQAQLNKSEMDRDIAVSSIARYDRTIDEVREKREQVIAQLSVVTDPTERLVLEMMEDTLYQREQRTTQDRDAAIIAREKAREIAEGTSQKIEAIKVDKPKLPPAPVPTSITNPQMKWFVEKVLPYFVTGALVIVLQALWEYVKIRLATP